MNGNGVSPSLLEGPKTRNTNVRDQKKIDGKDQAESTFVVSPPFCTYYSGPQQIG